MGRSSSHAWPADRTRTVRPPSDGRCTAWRSTAGAALTPARLQQLSCLASRLDAHSAPALCWLLHCLQVSCRRSSYTGTAAAVLMPGQLIGRARRARHLMAAALPGDQLQAQLLHRHGCSNAPAWPACRIPGAPALWLQQRCLQISCRCQLHTGTAAAVLMPGQQIGRARCARPLMATALPADQLRVQLLHQPGRCGRFTA